MIDCEVIENVDSSGISDDDSLLSASPAISPTFSISPLPSSSANSINYSPDNHTTNSNSSNHSNNNHNNNNNNSNHQTRPSIKPSSIQLLSEHEYMETDLSQYDYNTSHFQKRIKVLSDRIDLEFEMYGVEKQFERDSYLWLKTLQNPELPSLGRMLQRIFTVLRYGGLLYRSREHAHRNSDEHASDKNHDDTSNSNSNSSNSNSSSNLIDWKFWSDNGYPIASALSHGSRIIIQLPKSPLPPSNDDYDHSFWKWLITGDAQGDLSKYMSTGTSGSDATIEGKILFKRLGATHALEYMNEEQLKNLDSKKNQQHQSSSDDCNYRSSRYDLEDGKYNLRLPKGRRKLLLETKTSGLTLRDTKFFRSANHTLTHHRHWGMNLPLGGAGERSMSGKYIEANGEHGHLYLYYMAPKNDRFGGVMLGVEGSEYGKYDQAANFHGLSAKSGALGPTFGYKWHNKKGHRDLSDIVGTPDKYNSLLIDLTKTGWEFLVEKNKREWSDSFVTQTSLPVDDISATTTTSTSTNNQRPRSFLQTNFETVRNRALTTIKRAASDVSPTNRGAEFNNQQEKQEKRDDDQTS